MRGLREKTNELSSSEMVIKVSYFHWSKHRTWWLFSVAGQYSPWQFDVKMIHNDEGIVNHQNKWATSSIQWEDVAVQVLWAQMQESWGQFSGLCCAGGGKRGFLWAFWNQHWVLLWMLRVWSQRSRMHRFLCRGAEQKMLVTMILLKEEK